MGFFAPGYKKLENREERKKEVEQAIEKITPTPPEKEVEDKREEDLECELQLSPMDVDKVLVNGVELIQNSSAALRAACSFLDISGSGSKVKVYAKVLNHNKRMELLNAKSLVSEAQAQETREALGQSVAKVPDEAAQARRRLMSLPYANGCNECIEHRARPDRHERTNGVKRGSIPEGIFDVSYTRARDSVCWQVAVDSQTGYIHAVPLEPLGSKNNFRLIARELMNFSQLLGYSASSYRSDLKKTMDYCEERRKLLVLGNILRSRLEWEQKPQKANIRRIPCVEQLSIVQ